MCHRPIAAPDCRVGCSRILADPAEVFCVPGASATCPTGFGGAQGKAGHAGTDASRGAVGASANMSADSGMPAAGRQRAHMTGTWIVAPRHEDLVLLSVVVDHAAGCPKQDFSRLRVTLVIRLLALREDTRKQEGRQAYSQCPLAPEALCQPPCVS